MIDEKFFDGYINDIESLNNAGHNRYIVRGNREKAKHVTHPKAEWVGSFDSQLYSDFFREVSAKDKIFVHWYDLQMGLQLLKLDRNIPLYVSLMGGDFYEDPPLCNHRWLFDKLTLRYFNRRFIYPKKWARWPLKLLKQLSEIRKKKKSLAALSALKEKTVQRIDYILIAECNAQEVVDVRKMFHADHLKLIPFTFNQNFDFAHKSTKTTGKSTKLVVQVGNSATLSNNHLDLLNIIQRFSDNEIVFSVPLSYGDLQYASYVKQHYKEVLGSKVRFEEDYLGREEYIKKLQEIDVCIMYHNRSQGLGNCVALLTFGKKIYLKKKNPLWHLFEKIGVIVFDADMLSDMSYEDFIKPLTTAQVQNNIERLKTSFSEENRLNDIKKVFETY